MSCGAEKAAGAQASVCDGPFITYIFSLHALSFLSFTPYLTITTPSEAANDIGRHSLRMQTSRLKGIHYSAAYQANMQLYFNDMLSNMRLS